jgi:membrane protein YqaA with SNARE-associated domain
MSEVLLALGAMAASAFLAATILPFPSEATFAGLLHSQAAPALALFAVASVFNTLGSCVNFWIGRKVADGGLERLPKRFRPEPAQLQQAEALFARHGWPSLLLSWVPVVGDLATLAAGLLHYPLARFVVLVGVGKAARYGAIWAGWIAVAG